jgi:peptidoglycan hydrolase-like protein with peptidoglycan-binding domain
VREAQRVLRDRNYYSGPLDGLLTPATRRAVWDSQKAEGLTLSGRLEPHTMAALGLATTSSAATNFAPEIVPGASALPAFDTVAPRSARPATESQAP